MTKAIRKKGIIAICIILLGWMIMTMVKASSYSVLVADDFSHGNAVGVFHGREPISQCLFRRY